MSLAYLCDGNGCNARIIVDPSLIHVVPQGWVAMVVTQGTGHMQNPSSTKHLCPSCSKGYQFKATDEGIPKLPR